MSKLILKHFEKHADAYMAGMLIAMLMAGATFSFNALNRILLKVSVSESVRAEEIAAVDRQTPQRLAHADMVIKVYERLKSADCFKELCAEMNGERPEEKARCNLEKAGVFKKPAGYKWFESAASRSEAIKVMVEAFRIPMKKGQTEPFSDVNKGDWFAPYVAAAYKAGLIKDSAGRFFRPGAPAFHAWTDGVLSRTKPEMACER